MVRRSLQSCRYCIGKRRIILLSQKTVIKLRWTPESPGKRPALEGSPLFRRNLNFLLRLDSKQTFDGYLGLCSRLPNVDITTNTGRRRRKLKLIPKSSLSPHSQEGTAEQQRNGETKGAKKSIRALYKLTLSLSLSFS